MFDISGDWDDRAKLDHTRAVLGRHLQNQEFYSSGEADVANLVVPNLQRLGVDIGSSTVLELACGSGRMTSHLAAISSSVVAIDVSQTMIELAKDATEHASNVEFHQTDGYGIPNIPTGSVDVFCAMYVFNHMPTIEIVEQNLREAVRVLRPGGAFVIDISFQRDGWWKIGGSHGIPVLPRRLLWMLPWNVVKRGFKLRGLSWGKSDTWFGHKPLTKPQITDLLRKVGLDVHHEGRSFAVRHRLFAGLRG